MNSIAITMIKKGNYRMDVFAPERMTFIVVDSQEGYWTAFNSLGVSVLKAKTKSDVQDVLKSFTKEDLTFIHNQEAV